MGFYSSFAEHYEKIFSTREQTLAFLDAQLPTVGAVLDVGCGSGGGVAALGRRERAVVGADPDPGMVEAARAAHPGSEFRVLGMENLGTLAGRGFVGAYCVGNVLPHLPFRDLGGLLETMHGLLDPGAVWIVQTVNFDPLLNRGRHQFPVLDFPEDGLRFHRNYLEITETSLIFATRLERFGETLFEGETVLYPRRSDAYLQLHADAGFRLRSHCGDFAGAPYETSRAGANIMVFER